MKLVSPFYNITPYTERIIEFKGLNKNSVVSDGELRDMKNMTSDEYPCLYQRKARGQYDKPSTGRPVSMICKDEKLALIIEELSGEFAFYYDGERKTQVKGLNDKSYMVAINKKICFFPQKIFYDLVSEEVGNLEAYISGLEGEPWAAATLTDTGDGQKIDFIVNTEDISCFLDLAAGDAINMTCHIEIMTPQASLSKDMEIGAVIDSIFYGDDEHDPYIVLPGETFLELAEYGVTEASLSNILIDKGCPDLDFIMEYNNRLWGVSNADNTIYACKLGDPRNWQYFQNTTLDSYYAEQGTDGEWTGLAPYSGHMLFFKERYIHKVFGTSPATYQIATATAHGIERGSSKSVAIINDVVLYKSSLGIMAYEGQQPYLISSKFGSSKFHDVIAGTDGIKYYASIMKEVDGIDNLEPIMLVCDFDKGLWHKEDALRARDFCMLQNELMFINENEVDYFQPNEIYIINSLNPMANEDNISWMVEIGPFDEYVENKKVYSKMAMRLEPEDNAILDIFISIDDGEWEQVKHYPYHSDPVLFIPIVPRRCNKFSIKLEGIGRCRIKSLTRKFRQGTGGML